MGCCCHKCLKLWEWLWNWVTGRGWRSLEVRVGESLDFYEGAVGRKMDVKGDSGEVLDWSEGS